MAWDSPDQEYWYEYGGYGAGEELHDADDSGYEYDEPVDDVSVDEIRLATEAGLLCCSCGEPFVKAHNHRVACRFCFGRMTEAEVAAEECRLATHEESTVRAFKKRARLERKRRQA